MTITATPSEIGYLGNGVTLSFAIPFVFDTSADLKVYSTVIITGVITELTTGFTVTGGSGSTGNIAFSVAPASTVTITILDDPALTQPADYISNDAFPAETHERALDRVTRISKRLYQTVQKTLRVRDGDASSGDDLLMPTLSSRASKFLAFDANGNPIASEAVSDGDALLRAELIAGASSLVKSTGIKYDITPAETAALVTPVNFYLPTYDTSPGSIKRMDAVMDGAIDDSAALVKATATDETIFLPEGDLYINTVVTVRSNIIGCGDTGGGTTGRTTITLGPSGQLVVGNWWCHWSGFVIRSATNNKVFIKCAQSYFTMTRFRAERMSGATGQSLIEFDCSANSVYFATLENFKIKVDRPVLVTGTSSYVFNACKLGGSTRDYWQDFITAIAFSGVATWDANEIHGYFETGTNVIYTETPFKGNNIDLVADNVTNDLSTIAVITNQNVWNKRLGGTFNLLATGPAAGTYPTNQVWLTTTQTKVRATQATAQSMTNAAATVLQYDSEVTDSLSEFAPGTGTFTCKQPGRIRVKGGALSESIAWDAGERWETRIYKNGTEYAKGDYNVADAATTRQRSSYCSAEMDVDVGDTVDIRIIHNQGGAVLLDTAPTANFIEIERII